MGRESWWYDENGGKGGACEWVVEGDLAGLGGGRGKKRHSFYFVLLFPYAKKERGTHTHTHRR